ncbi:MAG: YidC/Oxa1 family insertase periplasmic-domain containing protein [Planctomycetota bacterium]|jgi:YidC/Oxa1 family membrane protein insertase
MSTKTILNTLLVGFIAFCIVLIIKSGLFTSAGGVDAGPIIMLASETSVGALANEQEPATEDFEFSELTAVNASSESVVIGSVYPDTGFKFALELTSRGAAISGARLSEFDDRDPKNPQPLALLAPIISDRNKYSLASGGFKLVDKKQRSPFPLDWLNWQTGKVVRNNDNSQEVTFEAVLSDAGGAEAIKLTKTYRLQTDSYDIQCNLTVENLSNEQLKAWLDLQGPAGVGREGARGDMRKVLAAFETSDGIESVKTDNNKLRKAKKNNDAEAMQLKHKKAGARFIWAAVTNKYFAAILRPVPGPGEEWPANVALGPAQYYDPGLADKKPDGDENSSFSVRTTEIDLAQAGRMNSSKEFKFQLYLGPKDKEIFDKNELYRDLGYFHTIDFLGCCCPGSVIHPLAFTIMGFMKTIYKFVPNYGIVIMILVFLVRLILHPLTKKSQVSMMKMQKLGPRIEEIKKKYANNKAEMQKQQMALYKEQGASPVMGFLPMMVQLPVLIALYSAIYANIALRGEPFLPFWITDLSVPDALITFEKITVPLLGWQLTSFNLLPVLLGLAMFLQQKLMPHSSAQANPQVAQQQKMMMVMMPGMMLIIFYNMASGLNLYFMSSTVAGVIEQIIIRKHIREKEAAEATGLVSATSKTGGKVKKKKPKPFFRH